MLKGSFQSFITLRLEQEMKEDYRTTFHNSYSSYLEAYTVSLWLEEIGSISVGTDHKIHG